MRLGRGLSVAVVPEQLAAVGWVMGCTRVQAPEAVMDERVSWSKGSNLFSDAEAPAQGERFDTLAHLGPCRVERIVSSAAPDGAPYDQDHDEWVVLLSGEAELEVAGEPVVLGPGDTLHLPAHTPHRVLRTSAGALWLAVHVSPPRVIQGPSD